VISIFDLVWKWNDVESFFFKYFSTIRRGTVHNKYIEYSGSADVSVRGRVYVLKRKFFISVYFNIIIIITSGEHSYRRTGIRSRFNDIATLTGCAFRNKFFVLLSIITRVFFSKLLPSV